MLHWNIVQSSTLIKQYGQFKRYNAEYRYVYSPPAVLLLLDRVTYARNRFNQGIQLLPTQSRIVERIGSPFLVRKCEVTLTRNEKHWFTRENAHQDPGLFENGSVTGVADFVQSYPRVGVLNIPTGTGKTVLSTLGMLHFMRNADLVKMNNDFRQFITTRQGITPRGTINQIENTSERVLLPNVLIVYSPKQLVSQWRDTFLANTEGFDCEIVTVEGLRAPSYDIDRIRAHPNRTFVYIVHHGNYSRFFVKKPAKTDSNEEEDIQVTEYTVGGFIVDEVDSETVTFPGSHIDQPIAMYTLLVTATAGYIQTRIRTAANNNQLIPRLFKNDAIDRQALISCFGDCFGNDDDDRNIRYRPEDMTLIGRTLKYEQTYDAEAGGLVGRHVDIGANAKRRLRTVALAKANMIAELAGINIVNATMLENLATEMAGRVPPMYSTKIRCANNFARTMGLVQNDMEDGRGAIERFERDLDLKVFGKTVQDVKQQLKDKIDVLPERSPVRTRLQNVYNRIDTISAECGVCMSDFSDDILMMSCCTLFVCKDCYSKVHACPQCRRKDMTFVQLTDQSSGGGAGAGSSAVDIERPVEPIVRGQEGFRQFLGTVNFNTMDQRQTTEFLIEHADRFGLTHVILAGAGVDGWSTVGRAGSLYGAYTVIRPGQDQDDPQPKKRKTAALLSKGYNAYCSGNGKAVLVLDSQKQDSVE
jgi:hypothetical protein